MEAKLLIGLTPELSSKLDALIAALGGSKNGSAPKPVVDSAKPAAEKVKESAPTGEAITLQQIREMSRSKSQGGKKEEVKALVAEYKVKSISDLSEELHAEFYEKLKAL